MPAAEPAVGDPTGSAADPEPSGGVPAAPERPLLELRDVLPPVVESAAGLQRTVELLRDGTGPVAVDAERASGYRYSSRAYLVQLRREGSGTALIDPIPFRDLAPLQDALEGVEWILHAASQDLPCLAELGMRPLTLFDTELAARLLGYPRVGLATLVETVLGRRLRKEHSAVDWSTRPLPESWLEYAALDVEVLVELREALLGELEATGKAEWARQEFAYLATWAPAAPREERWRRTSGMHRIRGRRSLAALRALWETRDALAAQRDITPGRLLPDAAIVEAATALPRSREALLALRNFRGRGAQRYATLWLRAISGVLTLPEAKLPDPSIRYDGPPPARTWADREPAAAARLTAARAVLEDIAARCRLPVENLLTPEHVRRLTWEPLTAGSRSDLRHQVTERLRQSGARPWQVELTAEALTEALSS